MRHRAAPTILLICAMSGTSVAAGDPPSEKTDFLGHIALTAQDSRPDWPRAAKAPAGAPNIVLILLDDIGFADTSTFGGVAETPELDKLAAQGLRYNNFNNASMCAPTRAALLSGRNHHRVGFGVAEGAGGYPGYDSVWKKSTVPFPEVLRRNGYSTAAFGKWHNTPYWETSSTGPFTRWPTGLGFDYFYGFIAGMENQWEPSRLYRDTTPVEAPATPEQGYHLTTDITNEAIHWLQTHRSLEPNKPYFLYLATGAVHSPHQAPREWIDKYRGRFDAGWDKLNEEIFVRQKHLGVIPQGAELTPRPQDIPAWDSLSTDEKTLYARQMEVYAGFIAHTDFEVGRLLKAVRQGGNAENTLILYLIGDNGAAEGGLEGDTDGKSSVAEQLKHLDDLGSYKVPLNWYASGWAWLGSTPFKGWKLIASHFGGVRDPMVVSWPGHIRDPGSVRNQFTHVNDVAATVYEVTGIPFPSAIDGIKQQPLDGASFAGTFDHPEQPSRHSIQYFEMLGNRAIYQNGWVAAARHTSSNDRQGFMHDRWELYNVQDDFSEAHDLAQRFPEKLNDLQQLFDREAHDNGVYPFDGGGFLAGKEYDVPSVVDHRHEFVYHSGGPRLAETAMPPLAGKSFDITATVTIPEGGARGVILSYGGRESGFALYIKDDRLVYENNHLTDDHEILASNSRVPPGHLILKYQFVNSKSEQAHDFGEGMWGGRYLGVGRLFVNGSLVAERPLAGPMIIPRVGPGSMGIGRAFGSPVSEAFRPPFAFNGTLEEVRVELK